MDAAAERHRSPRRTPSRVGRDSNVGVVHEKSDTSASKMGPGSVRWFNHSVNGFKGVPHGLLRELPGLRERMGAPDADVASQRAASTTLMRKASSTNLLHVQEPLSREWPSVPGIIDKKGT